MQHHQLIAKEKTTVRNVGPLLQAVGWTGIICGTAKMLAPRVAASAFGLPRNSPMRVRMQALGDLSIGIGALWLYGVLQSTRKKSLREQNLYPQYGQRSGFPRPVEQMRGAAGDFNAPRDMLTPPALKPWTAAADTN